MGNLAQPRQSSAPRTRKSPRREQDLCRRMREALVMLGGEAHRTTVIEAVAKEFGLDVRHIPDDLQLAMIMAFEGTYRDDARREIRLGGARRLVGAAPSAAAADQPRRVVDAPAP